MKRDIQKKSVLLMVVLLMPFIVAAQEKISPKNTDSYFSNVLFTTLFIIIIALLFLIAIMANVLKNIAQSNYVTDKFKKSDKTITSKTLGILAFFILLSVSASAEDSLPKAVAKESWLIGGLDMFTFYFMMAIILCEAFVLTILIMIINGFLKTDVVEKAPVVKKVKEKTILDKLNASVDIDKEESILLDHNYDGIRELDNDLPPWWKYGFYLTIIVAIIYFVNYHVTKTGDLQIAEYTKSLEKAKIEVDAYMKTAASNVDETTVKPLVGADLEAGKAMFINNCAACHGKFGEGIVGPNLTDNYWLHGGSIQDIFKTIKYGWPDKGMKSWKEDLSPMQIAQVASYIKSLRGSNPAKPKAQQGDLYREGDVAPVKADSLKNATTDTLHVMENK